MDNLVFDHGKIAEIIKNLTQTKIGLQFSKYYIKHATETFNKIKSMPETKGKILFLLADQSLGQCCVDFLSARNLNIEVIFHFGNFCNAKYNPGIPVYYFYPIIPHQFSEDILTRILNCCSTDPKIQNIIFIPQNANIDENLQKMLDAKNLNYKICERNLNLKLKGANILYIGNDDEFFEPFIWEYGSTNSVMSFALNIPKNR